MPKPDFLNFALSFDVPTSAFYTLPAVFEHAAAIGGITVDALMKRTRTNGQLGYYLASVAVRVAARDTADQAGVITATYQVQ
jgi:hypothetical protein